MGKAQNVSRYKHRSGKKSQDIENRPCFHLPHVGTNKYKLKVALKIVGEFNRFAISKSYAKQIVM